MPSQIGNRVERRKIAAHFVPFVVLALAGIAVRTPLAAAYPLTALLLFLWIVADTLMLSLMVRSSGKPERSAVLGALAAASITSWLASPSAVRGALLEMPILAAAMATLVLSHSAWAIVRAHRVINTRGLDRKQRWVAGASEILPPALVRLAAAELTLIHMALFRWGGPPDMPANARAFAYHKHLTPICATLLILSAIEIAVYHLLAARWSRTVTIVMFIVSDIGLVYFVGLIKSFRFRPVLLTPEGIRIRAGLLIDQFVALDTIVAVEGNFSGEAVRDPGTFNAALLAWPNVMLQLDRPLDRTSLLKSRGPFVRVAFRLDDPAPFIRLLAWRLGQRSS